MSVTNKGGQTLESHEVVEAPNSCEISVNAKGDMAFKVKAYGETVTSALKQAQNAANEMRIFVE